MNESWHTREKNHVTQVYAAAGVRTAARIAKGTGVLQ